MKQIKRFLVLASAALLALSLTACEGDPFVGSTASEQPAASSTGTASPDADGDTDDPYALSAYDLATEYDTAAAQTVTFDGASAAVTGGAIVDGGKVTINTPGVYVVTGKATDGQIVVNVTKEDKVHLVLNNAEITCQSSAAIHVMSADKVKITLVEGTVNRLTDSASYSSFININEPTGCVFSKDDLTFNGKGTLFVTGNYNNGIACKNDLRIADGMIYVTAVNHGLKGKDSVNIAGGLVDVTAGKDGIKSDNATESDKGFIRVSGGTVKVIAEDDALQAVTAITVTGGKITARAEGKVTNCDGNVDIAAGCLTTIGE